MADNIAKWEKSFNVQVETSLFDPYDLISITCLLSSFKLALDTNGIDEVAAIWLLYFFKKKQYAATLSSGVKLRVKSSRKHLKRTLTTHYEVLNYLLE